MFAGTSAASRPRPSGPGNVQSAAAATSPAARSSATAFGEVDRTRAFGGRAIIEDGVLHYVLSYRVSGGRGAEIFLPPGRPLATGKRTRTRFMTKLVFPFAVK
jgi:hypothetical protein